MTPHEDSATVIDLKVADVGSKSARGWGGEGRSTHARIAPFGRTRVGGPLGCGDAPARVVGARGGLDDPEPESSGADALRPVVRRRRARIPRSPHALGGAPLRISAHAGAGGPAAGGARGRQAIRHYAGGNGLADGAVGRDSQRLGDRLEVSARASAIFTFLSWPDGARGNVINFSSFGGYYHQALFGDDAQLVTWSHSGRRNREPALELHRLAELTSRKIINVCRDCDAELMRAFFATERVNEIDLELHEWKVFEIDPK